MYLTWWYSIAWSYTVPVDFCGKCGQRLVPWTDHEGRERRRCDACGWIWFGYPTPVALILAVAPDGRVAFTRQKQWPEDWWGLVAGFIEPGETAEAAALREVAEETGLTASHPEFMGTIPFRDMLLVFFRVRLAPGEPQAGSDADAVDLAEPRLDRMPDWFPSRQLLEQHLRSLSSQSNTPTPA